MKKLIITDRENIVAPMGVTFTVNGVASKEMVLDNLKPEEITKLEKNPHDKNLLAKIDRIKAERKLNNAR